MSPLDLSDSHPGFFDLDFVRRTFPETDGLTDAELLQSILDPDNTAPIDPNCIFNGTYYRANSGSDSRGSGQNPVINYLTEGAAQGASPNLFFDPNFFRRNAGRTADRYPTLVECALANLSGNLAPFHPFIDAAYIRSQQDIGPVAAFYEALFRGKAEIEHPHPLFSVPYVRECTGAAVTDLGQAIDYYWKSPADVSTHILFDTDYYRGNFSPEVELRHSVYHYLVSPQPPSPQPLFDTDYYKSRFREHFGRNPSRALEHFIKQGQELGLDPSPFFDVSYYRSRSGCGPDALQNYVNGGYRWSAPHPMVSLTNDLMLARASRHPDASTGNRLACWPEEVSLAATPDFDPVYYRNVKKDKQSSDIMLRDDYLRHAYPAGKRPNGLLSLPYIAMQCRLVGVSETATIRDYFRQEWFRRNRMLLALESFDDTPANRGWLALANSQLLNTDIELIVVAIEPGPLAASFADVAHIWNLPARSNANDSKERICRSGSRLAETLAPNPPFAAFIEVEKDIALVEALIDVDTPKIVFGGTGLERIAGDDAKRLAALADQILCPSRHTKLSLERQFEGAGAAIKSGFHSRVISAHPSDPRHTMRQNTRTKLGLPNDAVVVIGSGPLDIANNVDLFGAIAAKYLTQAVGEGDACFIWHGAGVDHPNTPAFYARYFARKAVDSGRLQIISEPPFQEILAAGDIYMKFCCDLSDISGVAEAKAAGLPVIVSTSHPGAKEASGTKGAILVDAFDPDAAHDALENLITNPEYRERLGEEARKDIKKNSDLAGFIGRVNAVLAAIPVDISLQSDPDSQLTTTMLVVTDDTMHCTLFADCGLPERIESRAVTRVNPARLDSQICPPKLRDLIDHYGCTTIVACEGSDGLDSRFVAQFPFSIWVCDGLLAELSEIYRIGLSFDRILVRNQEIIAEMSRLNPRIAARMSLFKEVGQ